MKPKQATDAERSIIANLMISPEIFHQFDLSSDDFFHPKAKEAYGIVCDLIADGEPVDPITVEARASDKLDALWLLDCTDKYLTSGQTIRARAKLVREAAMDRDVRLLAHNIFTSEQYSGAELLAYAQRILLEVQSERTEGGAIHIGEICDQVMADVENRAKYDTPSGLATGIYDFDKFLVLPPGGIMTIAGRPSMGKTAYLRWLVMMCILRGMNEDTNEFKGERVLVFSTESHGKTYAQQFMSMVGNINSKNIALSRLDWDTRNSLHNVTRNIRRWPLWIDYKHNDVDEVCAEIRRQKVMNGITMVVVDHLQEMRCRRRGWNQTDVMNYASESIRDVCREEPMLYCVLASQLNRDVEKREGHRPIMADMKSSGKIEELSDIIQFALRPHYYDTSEDDSRIDINWAKNRHGGGTGVMHCLWDPTMGHYLGPYKTTSTEQRVM